MENKARKLLVLFLVILALSIVIMQLYRKNVVVNIVLYGDNSENILEEDVFTPFLTFSENFKKHKRLGLIKSIVLYSDLIDLLKKSSAVKEIDFPNINLSFLDDTCNTVEIEPEYLKVPIPDIYLNIKYKLLVKHLNNQEEFFYIGDSKYLKLNDVVFIVGEDVNEKLISRFQKELE